MRCRRPFDGVATKVAAQSSGSPIFCCASFLLRLYEAERPRAVLVAWDSLDEPTYRNEALPAYQSGREFDDELVDQLDILPDFVAACGFANAKFALNPSSASNQS
jgi:DNA polymerase I